MCVFFFHKQTFSTVYFGNEFFPYCLKKKYCNGQIQDVLMDLSWLFFNTSTSASLDNWLQLQQSDVIITETSSALKQVHFYQKYVYTHDFCVIIFVSESGRKVEPASMEDKLFVGKSLLPNCWWELILCFLVDGILWHFLSLHTNSNLLWTVNWPLFKMPLCWNKCKASHSLL